MSRRPRKKKSLRSRPAPRRQRSTILIVCGGKTEHAYFNALRQKLRLSSISVDVVDSAHSGSPWSIITYARKLQQQATTSSTQDEYDEIWCVLDVEGPPTPGIQPALEDAAQNGFHSIPSNPCFEFWYLLHYTYTASAFAHCPAVVTALKNHLTNYSKGDGATFKAIYPFTDTALSNAETVIKHHGGASDPVACNPCTKVHVLVNRLLKEVGN